MFYLCSEYKGADQLRGYREADLRLWAKLICVFVFAYAKSWFSHNEAQIIFYGWCSSNIEEEVETYLKVPKFLDARKSCCNQSKIQTMMPNLRIFCEKDTNGTANSEDPDQTALRADQTAPLRAV